MKIMHIIGYFQPELGYQEYYLAREQAKEGHQVYLVTSDLIYPFKDVEKLLSNLNLPFRSRKREIGYSVVDKIKVYRLHHILEISDFVLALGLKNIIGKIRPDVIQAHEVRQGLPALAGLYKKKYGFKYIIDQHDFGLTFDNPNLLPKLEYNFFRKIIVNYALRKADKIIAIVEKARDFLIKNHRVHNKIIKIIPLAADTDLYKFNIEDRIRIREKLNIPKNRIVFIFSGSLDPFKKLHFLINAFAKLVNQFDNIHLILICGGNRRYLNYLVKLSSEIEKKDRIKFLDYMPKEKLSEYFSCADVGIFPAVPSIAILEQMACKLAIICPDSKTTRAYIQGNGITYNEISEISIYNAMKKIILDEKLLLEMRDNSLKLIETKFNWRKVAQDFVNEYGF